MAHLRRQLPFGALTTARGTLARGLAATAFLSALAMAPTGPARASDDTAGEFDFYVLALSWAPSFCAAKADANPRECGRDAGYGFIVHGLWPQFDRGFPAFCPSSYPDRVPGALGRSLFDIMPGLGLVGHEWRKHGTCSGLSQTAYFETVRRARDRVVVPAIIKAATGINSIAPAALENAFIDANPGLPAEGIAVTCGSSRLREVRVCLTRTLDFRTCPGVDARACTAGQISVPPVE